MTIRPLALALCCLAHQARADDQALARILADPQEQASIVQAAGRSNVVLDMPCADAQFHLTDHVTVYTPVTTDAAGAITAGAWKQVVQEQGCGITRTLNVLAHIDARKSLSATPLLPGATHADPQLQHDAVLLAAAAAGGPEKDCTVGYVADTEFLASDPKPEPGAKAAPWRELWTLMSCTTQAKVPIRFIPDRTGTRITAEKATPTPRPPKP
jgi:hypothetical protein